MECFISDTILPQKFHSHYKGDDYFVSIGYTPGYNVLYVEFEGLTSEIKLDLPLLAMGDKQLQILSDNTANTVTIDMLKSLQQMVKTHPSTITIHSIKTKKVKFEADTGIILSGLINQIYYHIGAIFMRLFFITEPDIRKGTEFTIKYSQNGNDYVKKVILHSTDSGQIGKCRDAIIKGETDWLSDK